MSSRCAARYPLTSGLPGLVTTDSLTQVMANLELISEFVNTADLEDRRDDLEHGRGLVRWLADHRLVNGPPHASERDAANARAVREALRELLRANNGVDVDRDQASATLDEAARLAGLAVRFDNGAHRLPPPP